MESSNENSLELEGFGSEVDEAAKKELLELVEVNPEDISDLDISDISDIETRGRGKKTTTPSEKTETVKLFKMLMLRTLLAFQALH